MKHLIVTISVLLAGFALSAQTITGKWKTIDDNTGKPKSIVEIYKVGDKYEGKVLELILEPDELPNPVCDQCDEDDARFNQPIKGMIVLKDMVYNPDENRMENGEILDPENGEVYDCEMWLAENGNLNVRGYVLFFYRTQQWLPVKN